MSLQVVIAGASGFLGTHLSQELRSRGHKVTTLVRGQATQPHESPWDPYAGVYHRELFEVADVVVNLAGSPLIGNPHSRAYRERLRESRVTTTRVLARAVAESSRRPALLAGNGISFYGDHGAEVLPESAASRGDGLLTSVARDWQDATAAAVDAGARVCVLRTAPVLDRAAAPLKQLTPLFRLGLGARLGSGEQFMPVISRRDWVAAVARLAEDDALSGPVNLCCPRTPTNAAFTHALASLLHRKALAAAPAPLMKVAAGGLAGMLLDSVNATPQVLERAGFEFRDRTVEAVLAAGLGFRG